MADAPPGQSLTVFRLGREVVTCDEAAAAKGIPLSHELKTMLLFTSLGPHLVHTRGDRCVSLRKVKNYLGVDQACLAPKEYLDQLHLAPGKICPLLEPLWSFPHLISSSVLALDFVSTNNGHRSEYFQFHPDILLRAARVFLGDFEKALLTGSDGHQASGE